jgi:predicted Co/Zn/Cd cation transporter (cation efflux family)
LTEQGFLRVSIAVTVFVAALGIVFGLLSGSFSIAFDGAYSLGDAGMTALALTVSSLILRSTQGDSLPGILRTRFTMGFWHLEPIVLGLNGILLMSVAIYALINAVLTIAHGGYETRFDMAVVYATITLTVCAVMAAAGWRVNRRLRSDFLSLDIKAWMMSGGITAALLVAFLVGMAVKGTPQGWIAPYVDPVILALVCLVVIPLPIGAVRQALSEILLITPPDLKARVDGVADDCVEREGFLGYRAYVAKVGRATQVELYFVAPKNQPAKSLEEWDRIRDRVGAAIGGEGKDRWLTIAFTTDVAWAE